jgi:lipopolysaccharide biosynthesis glycosyltransferase
MKQHLRLGACFTVCLVFLINFIEWETEQGLIHTTSSTSKKKMGLPKLKRKHREGKYAFVSLLAGIDPYETLPLDKTSSFLGYLLQLAAVRYMLDETGSKIDVILIIRIASGSKSKALSPSQEIYLSKLKIQIEYIPQKEDDSWSSSMMEKFQIFRFLEYKQVLFFDADILPLCNWDHYFHLREKAVFAPNLVVSSKNEPAQGGFFMLSSDLTDWETFQQLRYINETWGFGEKLSSHAESIKYNFTNWTWNGADSDQGLLYHWVRFVKKEVTFFHKNRMQRWSSRNGTTYLMEEVQNFTYTCPNRVEVTGEPSIHNYPIFRDALHFTGTKKPWQRIDWNVTLNDNNTKCMNRYEFWRLVFYKAWKKYELGSVQEVMPNVSQTILSGILPIHEFLTKNHSILSTSLVLPDVSECFSTDNQTYQRGSILRGRLDRNGEKRFRNCANQEFFLPRLLPLNHSENAIFTLLSGVDPFEIQPIGGSISTFAGSLLHFAAVRYILDKAGSNANFNILLRIQNSFADVMSDNQMAFFQKLRMNIEYLPKHKDSKSPPCAMEKFHIFRYHEYKHILFLDSGVLPLCNVDHYFDLQERDIVAPNLVVAFNNEPSYSGVFLISPQMGDWEIFKDIPDYTNSTNGFGVPLNETAEGIRRNYTAWNWHQVEQDQGVLYHWVRYVKKNVTILDKHRLRRYSEANGTTQLIQESHNFSIACPSAIAFEQRSLPDFPIIRDFMHFTGRRKPWLAFNWTQGQFDHQLNTSTKAELWAFAVKMAWKKYKLGSFRDLINATDTNGVLDLIDSFLFQK